MHGLSKASVLLIWMVSFTVVTGQDCTISNLKNGTLFDSNFDTIGMEETYSDEKQITIPCKLGFTGFFQIKCSSGQWTKVFGDKCTPKSCSHPGESLNADFTLVSGTDFVFTSVVHYKCHEGYIMVSRNPNRRCLDQGWSGNTPTCEAIKCPEITVGENVLVTGNRLQSSYGNVLQFGCRNRLLTLYGPLHIRCEENGSWSDVPPRCDEVKCEAPIIANGDADNTEYAEGQYLSYKCNTGYSPGGRRPQCVNIRKRAAWSQTPLCERVTCQLLQVRGTTYRDVNKDRFLPGEKVLVKCAQNFWFSYSDKRTQKIITCTESGEWDTAAICQEVRCQDPNDPSLKGHLQSKWIGDHARYSCIDGYMPASSTGWATCTITGWTPNPLCEEILTCNLTTRVENAVIMERKQEVYSSGTEVTYACRTKYRMEGESTVRCSNGQWHPPNPTCIVTCQLLQVRGTTYLDVNKDRFLPGEYVLVKCHQNFWFSYSDKRTQKAITCTESGEWNTAAICQEVRCQDPNDPSLKGHLQSKRIGDHARYSCKDGLTPSTGSATCTITGWTPNPLCKEPTDGGRSRQCEPPPSLPDGDIVGDMKPHYQHGETVRYTCQLKFTIEGDVKTCENGQWTGETTCLKPCTVGREQMQPHNIKFLRSQFEELDCPHNDVLTFVCEEGFVKSSENMKKRCVNGVMELPSCHRV